jgi:hypothetical protein
MLLQFHFIYIYIYREREREREGDLNFVNGLAHVIRGVSGRIVNILGGGSMDYSK